MKNYVFTSLILSFLVACSSESPVGKEVAKTLKHEQEIMHQAVAKVRSISLGDVYSHNILLKGRNAEVNLPDINKDSSLENYIYEFVDAAKANGVEIKKEVVEKIRVVKLVDNFSQKAESGAIAICERFNVKDASGKQEVIKDYWLQVEVLKSFSRKTVNNEYLMKKIMFHELTHCLMNKGHLPSNQLGIMSAILSDNQNLEARWDDLASQLFRGMSSLPDIED